MLESFTAECAQVDGFISVSKRLAQHQDVTPDDRHVMTEYWGDPEATNAAFTDGWFHTEDVGHFDSDGFLYVDGRIKDMIISGGENIYPAAVENVLIQCPELTEVAVVGRPDDHWGEVVVAVVVPNSEERDPDKILSFCEGRIAHFETPREVIFVDELPRNAMGKVVKEALRETVLAPPG